MPNLYQRSMAGLTVIPLLGSNAARFERTQKRGLAVAGW